MAAGETRMVALLRGVNVGKAKRVAMADLRGLVADLGYHDVTTLLNSGNVVFIHDEHGHLKGQYVKSADKTFDEKGHYAGTGDQLLRLLRE